MKMVKISSVLVMLVLILSIFSVAGVALAQNEQPTATSGDTIALSAQYPTINGLATDTFKFDVEMNYTGANSRIFNLKTSAPSNWSLTITPLYDTSKQISSVSMVQGTAQSVEVSASYSNYPLPDPGDYKITLQASADNITSSIDLTAKVTARYSLTAEPASSLYNISVKSGHDNYYTIKVENAGTAPVENIALTSDTISGWSVTFNPSSIQSLGSLETKTVEIDIKPAPKTVSGDYMLNIYINGKQASASQMAVRVTVETATVWGWVGIIIIVIVIAGLVLIFMRFGRR